MIECNKEANSNDEDPLRLDSKEKPIRFENKENQCLAMDDKVKSINIKQYYFL